MLEVLLYMLMPKDFQEAFQGIKEAVSSGRIGEERIEESLQRILRVKLQMGQAPAAKAAEEQRL